MTVRVPPTVLCERDTLRLILDGRRSLSRFGDGELGIMMCRQNAPGQRHDPALAQRLSGVAECRDDRLVVAVPRIYQHIPPGRRKNWAMWARPERIPAAWRERIMGSAFISRPDFYGEPFGADYWALMRSIWQGRTVLLVRGGPRARRVPALFDNAASAEVLVGPRPDAWADYSALLASCLLWAPAHPEGLVVAMLGPTATILAADLALQDVQTLDLGKAPRFYRQEMAV